MCQTLFENNENLLKAFYFFSDIFHTFLSFLVQIVFLYQDEPDDRGPTSLFLFTPTSPVRRLMTWLVNWPPFEWIIILTIMANCVVMALDDKLSNHDKSIMSIKLVGTNIICYNSCKTTPPEIIMSLL